MTYRATGAARDGTIIGPVVDGMDDRVVTCDTGHGLLEVGIAILGPLHGTVVGDDFALVALGTIARLDVSQPLVARFLCFVTLDAVEGCQLPTLGRREATQFVMAPVGNDQANSFEHVGQTSVGQLVVPGAHAPMAGHASLVVHGHGDDRSSRHRGMRGLGEELQGAVDHVILHQPYHPVANVTIRTTDRLAESGRRVR